MFPRQPRSFALIVAFLAASTQVQADFAQTVSDSLGWVLGAYALSAYQGGKGDNQELEQLATSLVATGGVTLGLKEVIHSRRPDGSDDESFPSMHVSLAAAAATVAGRNRPSQRWIADAYVGLMAWSRVDLDRHRERDVLAGALLGRAIGRHYSPQHAGFVLGKTTW